MKSCTLGFAAVMLASAGQFALGDVTYSVESQWDAVSSEKYVDGTGDLSTTNGWTVPSGGGATVTNQVIEVTMDESDETLDYTPKAPMATNKFETVYVTLTNGVAGGLCDVATTPQAALTMVEDLGSTNWYGWCGSGWSKLNGAAPAQGPCVVRIEFNNSNDVKLVRYAIKSGGSSYTVLKSDNAEWLTNVAASVSRVGKVGIGGVASFTGIELTQMGTLTADTTITNRMAKQNIGADQLNAVASNGNSNWENLVLGLDGRNEESQPVVQPVQSSDPTKITLRLGGVDVAANAGATVKYTVISSDAPGGTGTESAPMDYSTAASVTLPSSGVQYYRMKVTTMAN